MAPDDGLLALMIQWSLPEGVTFHSIIGNTEGTEPAGTDGFVAYESAHIEGVESEKVVKSDHSVQVAPAAILEVDRILRAHVK